MKKLYVFPILIGIIISLGLLFNRQTETGNTQTEVAANSSVSVGELSTKLQTTPTQIRAGEPTKMSFTISDEAGNQPTLMEHHARKVHTLIIGQDLNTFAHLHPEDFESINPDMGNQGEYSVEFTFHKAGTYLLGTDVMSEDGKTLSEHFTVNVSGESALSSVTKDLRTQKCFKGYQEQGTDRYIQSIATSESETDCSQGYQVAFTSSSPTIRPGQEVTLEYEVKKDGQPVTSLTPYLDAALHLAVVSEDLTYLSHAHGEPAMEGMGMSQGSSLIPVAHAHGSEETDMDHHDTMNDSHHSGAKLPAEFGPKLVSEPLVFPKAGLYQIFGQFKHEGNIIFTNFMLEVKRT